MASSLIHTNTDLFLEGAFWTGWTGLSLINWNRSHKSLKKQLRQSDSPEKPAAVWKARKELCSRAFSGVSGMAMLSSWFEEKKLISLGISSPFVMSFGYSLSALSCFIKAWDTLLEFHQGIQKYFEIECSKTRDLIVFDQVKKMISLTFYISLVAWGVFGSIWAFLPTAKMFQLVDTFLAHAIILFFVELGAVVLFPDTSKVTIAHS